MGLSPSIAPHDPEQDTYLVLDNFGGVLGCAWREADVNGTERETLIHDLLDGQYNCPVRIVAFNTSQGWSRDVTVEIADELRQRQVDSGEMSEGLVEFIDANRR